MWEWFINLLGSVLEFFAGICGDWGLAIIVLTVIIRLILTPLTIKSTKSSAQMQVLQPKMQEIQNKYADDPQRQQEELRKFYSEHKFNPLGGCLPLLLQMPVFFALFTVLKEVQGSFYGILPDLGMSVSGAVSSMGIAGSWVFILFDVLFGVLTFLPMYLQQRNSNSAQASQSLVMGGVMAVMMIWFGWSVPSGVLLYYNASALWGLVQQTFVTNRIIEKYKQQEEERLANAPIEVDVVRRERKQRQHKKS